MSYRTSSTLGAGTVLVAAGAILAYAVTATVSGVDIEMIGWILMIAGGSMVLFGLISAVADGSSRRVSSKTIEGTTSDGRRVREHESIGS